MAHKKYGGIWEYESVKRNIEGKREETTRTDIHVQKIIVMYQTKRVSRDKDNSVCV